MKIFDIAFKDLTRSFRSLFAIGMMFAAPLLITALIYLAFGGMGSGEADLPATRVVVVDLDTPSKGAPDMAQALIEMFNDESVSSWIKVSTVKDEAVARQMVAQQEASLAVILPEGFSQALMSGEGSPEVLLVQDPTLTIGPMVVENMIGSLIDGSAGARIALQTDLERRQELGLPPDPAGMQVLMQSYQDWFIDFQRSLYHSPQAAVVTVAPSTAVEQDAQAGDLGNILSLILAGQMIFFSFYTGAYSMTSILDEQEQGTLARLFTTPTDRTLILAGKFISVILLVIVQALVMMVAGALVFGVEWGQPVNIALAVTGQVVAATGLGVLLISLVRTSSQSGIVLGGGLTFLGMIGGLFTVGIPAMPKVFNQIGLFTPHGWVLKSWRACLAGGPVGEMWAPFLVLLAMGTIMFFIGAAIFRRRLA
ncbi:MAG: ABC transporter permease [Anaerolineales bacterium]|nr:ABC transporter permease [Anaerolineales bacterium]